MCEGLNVNAAELGLEAACINNEFACPLAVLSGAFAGIVAVGLGKGMIVRALIDVTRTAKSRSVTSGASCAVPTAAAQCIRGQMGMRATSGACATSCAMAR